MIGQSGLTPQDREDLEQELTAKVLQRLGPLDPRRHHEALLTVVVERLVANVLRDRRAEKRRVRVRSLAAPAAAEDGPNELAAAVGRPEMNARLGVRPRTDEELAQLAADVADVLAALPAELRALAERLKTKSIAEVARDLGVPRTTLYEAIRLLRMRFERAGLKHYLERSSSP
jgi:RNA polymerase sigma-70 factor (ECF subfamily)